MKMNDRFGQKPDRKVPCPECRGKGEINDPKYIGRPMMYCGPNGEGCPQMKCPFCHGERFVSPVDAKQHPRCAS